MHQLQGDEALGRFVYFLAQRILPEKGAVFSVFGFLLLNDLQVSLGVTLTLKTLDLIWALSWLRTPWLSRD